VFVPIQSPRSRRATVRLGLAATVAPFCLLAQTVADAPAGSVGFVDDVTDVAPVVVTATRTAETANETLASVSVLDREEIERRQSADMTDVLRGLPGVALSSSGGPGKATSLYLRGTNADHTLVLIDGIKVGSATTGAFPWQSLPVAQLDRVEVVRGPRSSLYGSEAIGGVVQIFTRRRQAEGLSPRVSAGAGTYNTARLSAGLAGGFGPAWFDAGLGFESTDGFNAYNCVDSDRSGCVAQPDDDGYQNRSGSFNTGVVLGDRADIDVGFLRVEGESHYDGSFFAGNREETVTQLARARVVARPLDRWTSTLVAGRSWDKSKGFFDDIAVNRYDTERDTLSWQNDIELLPEHLLTLGIDQQQERIDSTDDYAEDSRRNTGVFGQYLGRFDAADVQLSLRNDDNEQFGGNVTGSAALGWTFGNGIRLSGSYGTAFKAPTFNELYFPNFGNPDLRPESSRSAEIGVAGPHPWGEWAANAFRTEIDDLISFVQLEPFVFASANVDQARITGLELRGTARVADWDMVADVTLMEPVNDSKGTDKGNLLPRRPEQTVRLDVDRRFGRIGIGGGVFYSGRRFDDAANDIRLAGFTLVDLRAEYFFSDAVRVQAKVSNLLDEDYQTVANYNQAGRTLMLTLRYEP
jgi:vitamin B12 transporter